MKDSTPTKKRDIFGNVYKAQSLWRTIVNLFLVFEKIRWFIIAIFVTVVKNFFFDKSSRISRWTDFYMYKVLLSLYGIKMNSRERDTIRYAKNHKAIFLTNLSSSLDPLIVRY